MKHLLILLSIFLLSSPVIGQSSKCSTEKIKRMLDSEMSVDEIKQVCKKSTKPKKKSTSKKLSKPEKVITVKESSIPKIDIPKKPLNYSNKFDGGVFYSNWGTGLKGNYFYSDKIIFGGDFSSFSQTYTSSSGLFKSEAVLTMSTFEAYTRYYFRDLEMVSTDGFFGQGGIAIRNWSVNGIRTEISTSSKVSSHTVEWSPYVPVTGLGWHKIWQSNVSFSISLNGVWFGTQKYEYDEYLVRIDSDSDYKNEYEDQSLAVNYKIFIGYSF